MANIYVRSTDGSDADNGSTWALAKATIVGAAAIDAAGDTIWVSQAHSETAGSIAPAWAGSQSAVTRILCGNDAAEPPTALATGAILAATANFGQLSLQVISGQLYVYGFELRIGASADVLYGNYGSGSGNCSSTFENSTFYIVTTDFSQSANIFYSSLVVNPTFRISAAGQHFANLYNTKVVGGAMHASSTQPTAAFKVPENSFGEVDGFDFSLCSTTFDVGTVVGELVCRNCKLPASWTGSPAASPGAATKVSLYNCDSGDTNYRLYIETQAGTIREETTLVRSGGASDGATPLSWKMVASADALYPSRPLISDEIVSWNESTGASKTVTVEILHDSATNLKDDEIWLEVQYLGTSGVPLGSFIDDAKADVLATAADQTTSSVTWTTTGMSNPNKQKLSVTFTPQEKGFIQATVKLAKASKTVYVCPKLAVA